MERGIEREEQGMRERTQGRRVLETVAAVLPDQFRWTADTNCFSGLNRAVLSFARSFSLRLLSHLPRTCHSIHGISLSREDQFSAAAAAFVLLSLLSRLSSFRFVLTATLSPAACRSISTNKQFCNLSMFYHQRLL